MQNSDDLGYSGNPICSLRKIDGTCILDDQYQWYTLRILGLTYLFYTEKGKRMPTFVRARS